MKKKILTFIFVALFFFLVGCGSEEVKYTVTFNTNGGSNIGSQEVKENSTVTKPADPTKEGYIFSGWYLDEEEYNFNDKVTQDITLNAKWENLTYNVTFKYNNGESDKVVKVNANQSVSKPIDPEYTGHKFSGWFYNDDEFDFSQKITKDITLEAKWDQTINIYDSVGSWIGTEIIDGEEYIYKLTINNSLTGSITCVSKNSNINSPLKSVSADGMKLVIKFYDNSNEKTLELSLKDGLMNGNGIMKEEMSFRPANKYSVTYKYHNGTTSEELVEEYSKFNEIKVSALQDDLIFIGWFDKDGAEYTKESLVTSNLEVESVVYTNGLIFEENEVNYYYGSQVKVTIPSYYDGYKITTIAKETFKKSNIEEVIIPSTVEVIEESAFMECYFLETVQIKGTVNKLSNSAFRECYSLKNINLNEGLEIIDEYAFYGCINLVNVVLPESLKSIGSLAFALTYIETITFPKNIESIGSYAFHACDNLKEAFFTSYIPCDISTTIFTYIGEDDNIYYSDFPIWVPNGIDEEKPFLEYRKHVYLRDYASSIYPIKHRGETGYIVEDKSLLGYIKTADEGAFTYIDVPEGIEKIEDFAFYGNVLIEEVYMPEGFKVIGKYAFYNCTSVQYLYIPSTLEEIDDYSFTGFFVGNNISRLYLPEGFKRIGEGAFMSSFNLKIVEIPSTIEYIGYLAFGVMTSLERMYFKGDTPPEVGTYVNNVEEPSTEMFEIMNASNAIIYVPYGFNDNGEKIVDIYHNAPGFMNFAKYIKAKPEGPEVGHYGDGELFIDLDGCDTATIYTIVESAEDTSDFGGSKYEYKKENGTYKVNGFRIEMSFPTYGEIVGVYANRTLAFTYNGVNYKLVEPKKYYDNYNWTNFMLYETVENEGKGTFDMYGSFLTPFEWKIENDVFKIQIDGNNKLPEHSDYIGIKEYTGTYNKTTDSFSVSFMMNDYEPLMEYNATYAPIYYATGEVTKLYGKYVSYHETNKEYAMYTLVSYGNGVVDVYIGEALYSNCTYEVNDDTITIDLQSLILTLTIDKDGNLSGDFMGLPANFIYVDELLDSTKMPTD